MPMFGARIKCIKEEGIALGHCQEKPRLGGRGLKESPAGWTGLE